MGNKLIKTPLDPLQTFMDDPLRVLRLIRFASRLQFTIDPDAEKMMGNSKVLQALRLKISRERVGMEVEKMLKGEHPKDALERIDTLGLYHTVFMDPGSSNAPYPDISNWGTVYECLDRLRKGPTPGSIYDILVHTEEAAYFSWVLAAVVPWDYGGADSDLVGKLMCEITEARWTNAKCCVSTPPSSALSAVFEGQPSLQMPELRGPAMRKFALDQLASHEAFREMRGLDSRLLHQCVHDIVGAANGVFPWTELTIATAMDKHEKGDGMRELRTRIRRLPRGLGELYEYTSRPEYDAPVLAATD
ncbi:uncharacterized protein PG998_014199 [Apiospora kogelbergensis]|uniref:uncharacterized protein n=1 Tax=Apiospora kogelbergensis TaxID=1337665 RepID=UPI00312DD709